MDGDANMSAGIDTNAGMVAPADTQAANQGIHFDDHGMIKATVEEKVYQQHVRKLPATALGKSADLATAGVRHGTEELLEVLTTPQGQKFVQAMTANAVEGYVQSARTPGFKLATKEAAMSGYLGTLEVTEKWAKGYKAHFMEYIAPLSPGAPLLRWVGVFMAIMAAGSFTLLVSMLLLVWKVLLFGLN